MNIREEILKKRYFLKNENGDVIEDWDGLCKRVAQASANNEKEYQDFYHVMYNLLFLPNTPALVNAGRKGFSMSACFVLPIEDSIESIFTATKNTALIHKAGGGTGFDFSQLRPAGDLVSTTNSVASGPVSFIKVFDAATEAIKQGGTRRGANMGILRVDHPDILEFITTKKKEGELKNFNISVAITNEFMNALKHNQEFDLIFGGKVRKTLKAHEIWNNLIECAWQNGEPGVVFIDRINESNPTPSLGRIESTNPCGEQPLLPYEACVLGSVNLAKMVKNQEVDYEKLGSTVRIATRFLDNIIDVQHYPLPEIENLHKANRKIGLGIMGWADMLILLGIKYDSPEAVYLAREIMEFITEKSISESKNLAEEKGVFPNWGYSVWHQKGIRMRNATTTTIAPTGSISIIANTSSGIEPIFEFETIQHRVEDEYRVVHPLYENWMKNNSSKPLPPYFITAKEIPPEWHIKMQAAFQKHTHNAVSKTINLPNSATKDDVEKAFLLAYELGCKGITVYRNGSREEQVISSAYENLKVPKKIDLPTVRDQKLIELQTIDGKVFVHITLVNGKPVEVFTTTQVGRKNREIYDAFARVFSIALRQGVPVEELLNQLEKANANHGHVSSIPAAIIRAFKMIGINGHTVDTCPDCSGVLVLEEGCVKCLACGYTKC